ncbi:hypothetical protein [Aurantiacibacter marinus]|uniref:Uncharacterized protein n=1 Tax=Aurantiacibacter marinus TaxID=874156 RepID=A0A0H0XMZ0_9SPHN|nr:hypothetical protein [Aurantiacibacter marinus]KLI63958.1 hypothetical protein AAV99_09725 [Aurantiacibacter marinus]
MSEHGQPGAPAETLEVVLRAEVAHGDAIIATTGPVLHHLLVNDDQTLFSDLVIARVRGMMADIARQLLFAVAEENGYSDKSAFTAEHANDLAVSLLAQADLLSHAHALTIEAQTTDRLAQRNGIDPVLPSLLQELASSSDAEVAGSAMRVLASQARFMQQQRRMSLPLNELPEDLLDLCLSVLRSIFPESESALTRTETHIRGGYDPAARRVGLIGQLITNMKQDAVRTIDIDRAGVAIFATGLAMATGQSRDKTILTLGEKQCARLSLSLLSAGLKHTDVEDQFLFLHPEVELPEGFQALTKDRAAAMLAVARPEEMR